VGCDPVISNVAIVLWKRVAIPLLTVWRDLWSDGDDLARSAHRFMAERLEQS